MGLEGEGAEGEAGKSTGAFDVYFLKDGILSSGRLGISQTPGRAPGTTAEQMVDQLLTLKHQHKVDILEKVKKPAGEWQDLTIVAQASFRDPVEVLHGYAELGIAVCDLIGWGDGDRVIRDAEAFAERVGTRLDP